MQCSRRRVAFNVQSSLKMDRSYLKYDATAEERQPLLKEHYQQNKLDKLKNSMVKSFKEKTDYGTFNQNSKSNIKKYKRLENEEVDDKYSYVKYKPLKYKGDSLYGKDK